MTRAPVNQFAILGFPKCGTTGLARHLSIEPAINVIQIGGDFEFDLTKRPDETSLKSDAINGHKLASYVYDDKAIRDLLAINPDCLFILCFRHPRCAIHSWHAMHKRLACGEPSDHPAWRDRQFYGLCSVEEYFQRHAWLLHYDIHLGRLL